MTQIILSSPQREDSAIEVDDNDSRIHLSNKEGKVDYIIQRLASTTFAQPLNDFDQTLRANQRSARLLKRLERKSTEEATAVAAMEIAVEGTANPIPQTVRQELQHLTAESQKQINNKLDAMHTMIQSLVKGTEGQSTRASVKNQKRRGSPKTDDTNNDGSRK